MKQHIMNHLSSLCVLLGTAVSLAGSLSAQEVTGFYYSIGPYQAFVSEDVTLGLDPNGDLNGDYNEFRLVVDWWRTLPSGEEVSASEDIPLSFMPMQVLDLGNDWMAVCGESNLTENTVIELKRLRRPELVLSPSGDVELSPGGLAETVVLKDDQASGFSGFVTASKFRGVSERFMVQFLGGNVVEYSLDGTPSAHVISSTSSGVPVTLELDDHNKYAHSIDHPSLGRLTLLHSMYPTCPNESILLIDSDHDSFLDGAVAVDVSYLVDINFFDVLQSEEDPYSIYSYTDGVPFCFPADNNSTGNPAVMTGWLVQGGASGLHLEVFQGVPGLIGYVLIGTGVSDPGMAVSEGHLCLSLSGTNLFGRYNVIGGLMNSVGVFDQSGVLQNASGTSEILTGYDVPLIIPDPIGGTIASGSTWHFQTWYRNDNDGTSNFSNGLSITF